MKKWIVFCLAVVLMSCSSSFGSELSTTLKPSIQSTDKPTTLLTNDFTMPPTQNHELTATLTITPTENQPTETPPIEPFNVISDTIIAYLKEGDIYLADYSGNNIKVFNMEEEDRAKPEKPKMKISPDWKYLAYIGVSEGTKPAIKVIDLETGVKIFQDIFPNAVITDFAWSADSTKIVAAYYYVNGEDEYSGFISLLDPFLRESRKTLFDPENIEVTQIEWPNPDRIVYSYYSHGPEPSNLASIASYDTETRKKIIKNLLRMKEPHFWFALSPDGKKVYFYNSLPYDSNENHFQKMFLVDSLIETSCDLCGNAKTNVVWFDHYALSIGQPIGSPDQTFYFYNLESGVESRVPGPGPNSWIYSLKVVQRQQKTFLIEWSERNTIWVGDLDEFIVKMSTITKDDLFHGKFPTWNYFWFIEGAWPDSASLQIQ